MDASYIIPADNVGTVEQKLALINRKAVKMGLMPVSLTWAHDHVETWTEPLNEGSSTMVERSRLWLKGTISGATAEIGGYYFRATIHHTSDGNIIAATPGYEVPREFRNAPSACQHCNVARRRSATYLVESKDGLLQVGRSCLGDFMGAHDPHRMAAYAESLGAFNSWFGSLEDGSQGHVEICIPLETWLGSCAAVIRRDGWVSKRRASETDSTATASTVWSWLTTSTPKWRRELDDRYGHPLADEDTALAATVLEWLTGLAEPENDYLHNLTVIAGAGLVNYRTTGLAASAIIAYRKATNTLIAARERTTSPSTHVGTVGDRLRNVGVTVEAMIELEADMYGPRRIIKLVDDAGNLYVWFTGSFSACAVGDRMSMTGTVKRHSTFADAAQTELSRCKLVMITPAPEAVA